MMYDSPQLQHRRFSFHTPFFVLSKKRGVWEVFFIRVAVSEPLG